MINGIMKVLSCCVVAVVVVVVNASAAADIVAVVIVAVVAVVVLLLLLSLLILCYHPLSLSPQAGDPDDTGSISFIGLIQLLSKHQLYISESGLIARYGKTKSSSEGATQSQRRSPLATRLREFLYRNMYAILWIMLYVALNLFIFAVGVGAYSRKEGLGGTWRLWAFGTGPVLSMNCVLILLPTLSSLIHAMRNSCWINKVG